MPDNQRLTLPYTFNESRHCAYLTLVDVIVGMHGILAPQLPAEDLDGPVGNHLVDVHVGLRPGTRLPDYQGEVVLQFAIDDLKGVTTEFECYGIKKKKNMTIKAHLFLREV